MTRSEKFSANSPISRRDLLKAGGGAASGLALGSMAGGLDIGSLLGGDASAIAPRTAKAATLANQYFQRTWARTDQPVAEGVVSRTWMWGPEASTDEMIEPYLDSPGGERVVQYFDKSRMEITRPDTGDPTSIWYVTNGLLVTELVTGRMQVGDASFIDLLPAQVNVAGDLDDPNGPTYATFATMLDVPPLQVGATIIQRIDRQGTVTSDPGLADQGISVGIIDDVTNHSIAAPFWEFMNSSGTVFQNGQYVQDRLFENPYFATGRPITEPYWAEVLVGRTLRLVLMQCFERRCLTYTPGNPPGWVVEAGNVGLHYYRWRYGDFCVPAPADHKPKMARDAKLRALAESNQVPSTLASIFFKMGQRFLHGHSPANELEAAAFETFGNLPPATRNILECSLEKLNVMPADIRDRLFDSQFGVSDTVVSSEELANALAIEIVRRSSELIFDDPDCLLNERPGQARELPRIDAQEDPSFNPTIYRINRLRTVEFGVSSRAEFQPHELQQECSLVPVDNDVQLNCEFLLPPFCEGNAFDGVCLRVPEIRAGERVVLTGANYFNTAARVRLRAEGLAPREVEAHVCGDIITPLTEDVLGSEKIILDSRVRDRIAFRVPENTPSGIYTIQVIIPNNTGRGSVTEFSSPVNEYIRVVAPEDATFQIACEELYCIKETSRAWLGSDEVGLRVVTVPVQRDGTLGAFVTHKFGGGTLGIIGGVDSGDRIRPPVIPGVLFNQSNIAGVAMTIIGFEVDLKSAYQAQIQGFIDAFIHVMESNIVKVIGAIIDPITNVLAEIFPKYGDLIKAIGSLVRTAIVAFVALWAPADLIIEDMVGLTELDLDARTSPLFPVPPIESYRTAGNIDVTVNPFHKVIEYREHRVYQSRAEDSEYQIALRYSRF